MWAKFVDNIFPPRHRRGEKKGFQLFYGATQKPDIILCGGRCLYGY
ncbi:MAG: hypothetical protein LBR79_03490 [Oscillospiraceae bacterium]|nr:hypothetical protein [Oscillospiraceae bacterium]